MQLRVSNRTLDGVAVVDCQGRIVFGDECMVLREQIKSLLPEHRYLVLNLANVNYIDSGGMGTLVGLFTSAQSAGGNLKLAALTKRVDDVLQITKLVTVFETYETVEEAVASYRQPAAATGS